MYALVAPLRRVPKKIDGFWYSLPNDKDIKIGDLVEVSLGKSLVFGLVVKIENINPDFKTKPIQEVLISGFIDNLTLDYYKELSELYFIPLPTILSTSIPSFTKKDLVKLKSFDFSKKIIKQEQETTLYTYIHQETLAENLKILIDKNKDKGVCIIVPTTEQATSLSRSLKNEEIILWSESKNKTSKIANWLKMRCDKPIAIGSRSLLFAPMSNIGLIIIIDESHFAHKQTLSQPRIYTPFVLRQLQKLSNISLAIFDIAPRIETMFEVLKKEINHIQLDSHYNHNNVHIIDRKKDSQASNSLFGYQLEKIFEESIKLNNKIAIVTPLVKSSHNYKCNNCFYFFSTNQAPENCPKCRSYEVFKKTYDGSEYKSYLNKNFPGLSFEVFSKEAVFEDYKKFSTFVFIDMEYYFSSPSYNTDTKLFLEFYKFCLSISKDQTAFFYVNEFEKKIWSSLEIMSYKQFFSEEINNRKALGYPPFKELVSVYGSTAKDSNLKNLLLDKFKNIKTISAYEEESLNKDLWRINIKVNTFKEVLNLIKPVLTNDIIIDLDPLE